MARTPATIAREARENLDKASTAFIPVNVVRGVELGVEFMEATAAALEAAGIAPQEPAEQPAEGQ